MTSAAHHDLAAVATLVRREMLKLVSERARLLGLVVQPLVLWIVFSFGFDAGFGRNFGPTIGNGGFLAYFFPGVVVMTVLFGSVFASMTIIDDRSGGFLQAALVSPARTVSIVVGKTAGVMLVVLMQVAAVCLAGWLVLRLRDPAVLLPVLWWAVLSSFALVPINLAVALFLGTTQSFHAFMGVVLFPAWAFSGALFPMQGSVLSLFAMLNPLTYMVGGLRRSFDQTASVTPTLMTHPFAAAESMSVASLVNNPMIGSVVLFVTGILGLSLACFALRRTARSL